MDENEQVFELHRKICWHQNVSILFKVMKIIQVDETINTEIKQHEKRFHENSLAMSIKIRITRKVTRQTAHHGYNVPFLSKISLKFLVFYEFKPYIYWVFLLYTRVPFGSFWYQAENYLGLTTCISIHPPPPPTKTLATFLIFSSHSPSRMSRFLIPNVNNRGMKFKIHFFLMFLKIELVCEFCQQYCHQNY